MKREARIPVVAHRIKQIRLSGVGDHVVRIVKMFTKNAEIRRIFDGKFVDRYADTIVWRYLAS
jgi:hypothetical protein